MPATLLPCAGPGEHPAQRVLGHAVDNHPQTRYRAAVLPSARAPATALDGFRSQRRSAGDPRFALHMVKCHCIRRYIVVYASLLARIAL
jgi:hypothetical protein